MAVKIIEEFNYFGQIADELRPQAREVVKATIYRIEARWKASLSGARSGRVYRRGKRGTILHRASAPGEPPATDTGNLVNSIYAKMTDQVTGEVGSTAKYAAVLELGGAHMAARPALRPALKAELPEFENAMNRLIDQAAHKAGAHE